MGIKLGQAAEALNAGGSIFGELGDNVRKLSDIKEAAEQGAICTLGRFEVLKKTKNQNSPYVTLELNEELFSGYGTAIGNKLMKLVEAIKANDKAAEVDGTHYSYDDNADILVKFKVSKSQAGEYIDIIMVDENGNPVNGNTEF